MVVFVLEMRRYSSRAQLPSKTLWVMMTFNHDYMYEIDVY